MNSNVAAHEVFLETSLQKYCWFQICNGIQAASEFPLTIEDEAISADKNEVGEDRSRWNWGW